MHKRRLMWLRYVGIVVVGLAVMAAGAYCGTELFIRLHP